MNLWGQDEQERTLRLYTVLRLLRKEWGGALILCGGLGPQGMAVAMAANMVGAVCLNLEDRPERLKEALRSGSCDFIVNTLDEALRTMKNEVRKRKPVSVGLEGDPATILRECLERGVQPEVVIDVVEEEVAALPRDGLRQLRLQGATQMRLGEGTADEGAIDAIALLDRFVTERQWELRSYSVQSISELRVLDACAMRMLAEEDTLRRQWLRSASRMAQRKRPLRRVLWMTAAEGEALEAELRSHPA